MSPPRTGMDVALLVARAALWALLVAVPVLLLALLIETMVGGW